MTPVPRAPLPLQPLMRFCQTITPPWEGMTPTTLQVVVLADSANMGVGDETAAHTDLPELREAGWVCHDNDGLQFWIRVIN